MSPYKHPQVKFFFLAVARQSFLYQLASADPVHGGVREVWEALLYFQTFAGGWGGHRASETGTKAWVPQPHVCPALRQAGRGDPSDPDCAQSGKGGPGSSQNCSRPEVSQTLNPRTAF